MNRGFARASCVRDQAYSERVSVARKEAK
jgi:hypothetical protein